MKIKKKLKIISLINSDKSSASEKAVTQGSSPYMKSMLYRINSIPYRLEYTEKGLKVWVIN